MQELVGSRIASLLVGPLPMKPQTQRQLEQHLTERNTDLASFLLCASEVLEDFELETLFGPLFTPTLDQRAQLSDLLLDGHPTAEQLKQVVDEVCERLSHTTIRLPDGSEAKLTLHKVLVERFVRLLRLEAGPDAVTAAAMRDALPQELWPIGIALMCEHGMTPQHQSWLEAFIGHMASQRVLSRGLLEDVVRFIAGQSSLERETLLPAAEALQRATEGSAAYAAGGHAYWSPDVAQHHQYRGQGRVDPVRLEKQQAELAHVNALVEDLRTFESVT
jgi:hypothetical protein